MADYIDRSMPSVDVVEVVRCKDCKYYRQISETRGACEVMGGHLITLLKSINDYCSGGEKE